MPPIHFFHPIPFHSIPITSLLPPRLFDLSATPLPLHLCHRLPQQPSRFPLPFLKDTIESVRKDSVTIYPKFYQSASLLFNQNSIIYHFMKWGYLRIIPSSKPTPLVPRPHAALTPCSNNELPIPRPLYAFSTVQART